MILLVAFGTWVGFRESKIKSLIQQVEAAEIRAEVMERNFAMTVREIDHAIWVDKTSQRNVGNRLNAIEDLGSVADLDKLALRVRLKRLISYESCVVKLKPNFLLEEDTCLAKITRGG